MPEPSAHPAALPEAALLAESEIRRQRRSGPGGQHRNKVETAVVITHLPSEISGEASERRSQEENRRVALFRLRVNLARQLRRELLPETGPSELWRSRLKQGKLAINPEHDDFPALLAEALDMLADCRMDVKQAAARLGCTSTQFVKFIAAEPRAFAELNAARRAAGLRALRP